MATPQFDALVAKTRDWSNKPEANTIPDSVIIDCLKFSADECYRQLRIPPLEATVHYVVASGDNSGSSGPDYTSYTSFNIPEDMSQFGYIRVLPSSTRQSVVFNEITDKRTFFDVSAEKYSRYNWMWQNNKIFLEPQQPVDTVLELHYYRRLPSLDALYSVVPINYIIGLLDANQPYLTLVGSNGTSLYFSTLNTVEKVFLTNAEAAAYSTPVTTKMYIGKESPNWLRDINERLLIFGALYNLGAYLFDAQMEQRYEKKFLETLTSMNREEKIRRTLGGNVQTNINAYGLI